MAFREVVEIFVDVKTEQAKSAFSNFKQSIAQAEGATGKLKAAASGAGQALTSFISSPAGLATVGTAVASFATKAVGDFEELGLAVGKLSDSTGLAAEDASRWIEVTGDAGISTEQFTSAVSKLEKGLATNADAFAKWGVEIVKASDGTVDMNATLINAFDTLGKIEDPTKRAAAGTALFGKSWTEMSELVQMGAGGLTKALNSVSDAKVLSKKDVDSARQLRDALDDLKGVGEDLTLTLGKNLAPAIADMVSGIQPAVEGLGKFLTALTEVNKAADKPQDQRGIFDTMKREAIDAISPIDNIKHTWQDFQDTFSKTEDIKGTVDLLGATADATTDVGDEAETATKKVDKFAGAQDDLDKFLRNVLEAMQAQNDALAAQAESYSTAADDQLTYNDSLAKFNELNGDAKSSTDDVRDAAIASAKAHQALYESLVATSGATVTATGKIDAQNSTLLEQAKTARGPARQAILDYIGTLNGIPPEKMTEIQAAIDRGDLAEAQRLLDEASAPRKAAMIADANNAALAQTNKDLDSAAHDRTVKFNAQAVGLSALTGAFAGAIQSAGGTTNNTFNVTVPRIPNARELARVNAQWARVNGRR